MSEHAPDGPYIYQPYGIQHPKHWDAKRIYAIGGLNHLTEIRGLTKQEAEAILSALSLSQQSTE